MNSSSPATSTFISIILPITLTSQFLSLLSSFNLTQHVNFPTHNKHHILNLVIASSDCSLAPSLSSSHCSPSDHFPVFTILSINPSPLPPPTLNSFHRFYATDISSFLTDLKSSRLITHPPKSLGSLLIAYNTTLSSLHDKHAPVITKFTRRRSPSNPSLLLRSVLLDVLSATLKTSGNTPTVLCC